MPGLRILLRLGLIVAGNWSTNNHCGLLGNGWDCCGLLGGRLGGLLNGILGNWLGYGFLLGNWLGNWFLDRLCYGGLWHDGCTYNSLKFRQRGDFNPVFQTAAPHISIGAHIHPLKFVACNRPRLHAILIYPILHSFSIYQKAKLIIKSLKCKI